MMDVEEFDPAEPRKILAMKPHNHLDLSKHKMIEIYIQQYMYLKQSEIMKDWGMLARHLSHRKIPKHLPRAAGNIAQNSSRSAIGGNNRMQINGVYIQ